MAEDPLTVGKGETISLDAIAYSATGPSYLSASFLSLRGVWHPSL